MHLEREGKPPIENPKTTQIRKAVLDLKSYGPSSYASITDSNGSYLQVAGGGVTCLLEFYQASTGKMFRAFSEKKSSVFPDGTLLVFSAGRIVMKSDEWFMAEKVITAFCYFAEGKEWPSDIHWRPLALSFNRNEGIPSRTGTSRLRTGVSKTSSKAP